MWVPPPDWSVRTLMLVGASVWTGVEVICWSLCPSLSLTVTVGLQPSLWVGCLIQPLMRCPCLLHMTTLFTFSITFLWSLLELHCKLLSNSPSVYILPLLFFLQLSLVKINTFFSIQLCWLSSLCSLIQYDFISVWLFCSVPYGSVPIRTPSPNIEKQSTWFELQAFKTECKQTSFLYLIRLFQVFHYSNKND